MFILLEKEGNSWSTPEGFYTPLEFESEAEASDFRDEQNLIDAAIFELKGFM